MSFGGSSWSAATARGEAAADELVSAIGRRPVPGFLIARCSRASTVPAASGRRATTLRVKMSPQRRGLALRARPCRRGLARIALDEADAVDQLPQLVGRHRREHVGAEHLAGQRDVDLETSMPSATAASPG